MKQTTLSLLLILLCIKLSLSQGVTITGVVKSAATGESIPGVSVLVKGTTIGTSTDMNGTYSITAPNQDAVLVFSFVGMKAQEVPINQRSVIDVQLEEETFGLEEVVVVAYGTTSKKSFTGSASVVETEKIDRVPVTSFEKALSGSVAGVQVSNSSGQPGSGTEIRIRGIGSFSASSDPLYVIDGVPVMSGGLQTSTSSSSPNPGNVMSTIPPGDIESITVLKDAAAASLYGSRAANGVILITTKKGREGVTKYNFKTSYGVSDFAVDNYKTVSGEDFTMLHREELENYYGVGAPEVEEIMEEEGFNKPAEGYTDWYDYLFRKGKTYSAELSATGGSEKTQFYISGGYFDQEGLALTSGLERFSGRINVTHKVSKMISLGANILNSLAEQNIVDGGTNYFNPMYNVSRNCFPTESPFLENGEYRPEIQSGYYNLVREYELNQNTANIWRSMNTGYIEIRPFDFLTFRSTNSYDRINNDELRYASPLSRSGEDENGYVRNTNRKSIRTVTSNLLTFDKTFLDLHHVNLIAAYEAEEDRISRYEAEGENLPNETLNNIGVTSTPVDAYGYDDGATMMSFLSRLNYDYKNKYYVSGSFRRDGSSRLGANERWANFWSVSGAWRLSSEQFMESFDFINDLKFRVSYGTNGTLPPGRYEHLALYSYSYSYDGSPAAVESQIANPNLTWEKNANFNAGTEFTLFERVSGSIEYFSRHTYDLLMNVPISPVTGFDRTWKNVGEMKNTGWEIALKTRNIDNKQLKWTSTFSYTTVNNEIVKLSDGEEIIDGRYIRREGEAYYTFWMPIWAGVNPDDGSPLWYIVDEDGNITNEKTGNIDEADPAIAGKADPDFFGSVGNELSYKGFNLSFLFNFSVGGQIYYSSGYKSWNDGYKSKYAIQESQLDRWQEPGDHATHPKRIWKGNNNSDDRSSRFILDNNYLRLKDITLSYLIPEKYTQKLKVNKLTVYLQATNYFTWAQQDVCDPEQRANGYTNFEMPNVKTITGGIEIGF